MNNSIAQIRLAPPGGFRGPGPLGLEGGVGSAPGVLNQAISTIVGVMTIIAFIWFVILFLIGAIGVITSGGDKAALEAAKKKLTTGIAGLIVVVAAIFIIQLIGTLLGIDLILNPAGFIQ